MFEKLSFEELKELSKKLRSSRQRGTNSSFLGITFALEISAIEIEVIEQMYKLPEEGR